MKCLLAQIRCEIFSLTGTSSVKLYRLRESKKEESMALIKVMSPHISNVVAEPRCP
jgi:hypothetical protein